MSRELDVLAEAGMLIGGDRAETHGDYTVEAARIADLWGAILDIVIEPETVPLLMVALKLARASGKGRLNRDDFVDMAGYAALGWRVASRGD